MRAIGNITFGNNMLLAKPILLGTKNMYYSVLMKKVGEYNRSQNKGESYNMGFPFLGEHNYSGTYIYMGFFKKWFKK